MFRNIIDPYIRGVKYIMSQPSWKNRRRYIFASFVIGAFMLIASSLAALTGAMTDISDLVTGGVALITLILTSYIFGAVWEDKSLHKKEENPDG
jgi:hypothetical protein